MKEDYTIQDDSLTHFNCSIKLSTTVLKTSFVSLFLLFRTDKNADKQESYQCLQVSNFVYFMILLTISWKANLAYCTFLWNLFEIYIGIKQWQTLINQTSYFFVKWLHKCNISTLFTVSTFLEIVLNNIKIKKNVQITKDSNGFFNRRYHLLNVHMHLQDRNYSN